MSFKLPPKPSFHLEKISLRANPNFFSYHHPFCPYGLYCNPIFTAQKKSDFFIPVRSAPLAMILSYTFSYSLGTAVMTTGFTSLRLSLIVSNDSAK